MRMSHIIEDLALSVHGCSTWLLKWILVSPLGLEQTRALVQLSEYKYDKLMP